MTATPHPAWPEISLTGQNGPVDTRDTLHLWTQVVGKIRTGQLPWVNHSWHVTLYLTPRGLTTLSMPHGERSFQIEFDFYEPALKVSVSDGSFGGFPLAPMTVADFYARTLGVLQDLDLPVTIHEIPNEIAEAIPFSQDTRHKSFEIGWVQNLHRALLQAERIMTQFRARFIGKCSPVHFFWGSFDLAVTRFSERTAPMHPGGFPNMPDWITREAYSHEVSSAGFWPGDADNPAIFYSYAYPTPLAFGDQPVEPAAGGYSQKLGEFVLPYEAMRQSATPDADLLAFFQTTYEAAASCAQWDRETLEWDGPVREP